MIETNNEDLQYIEKKVNNAFKAGKIQNKNIQYGDSVLSSIVKDLKRREQLGIA